MRENFIGRKWVPARAGGVDTLIDPATGEAWEEIASSAADDVSAAVEAANAAFPEWSEQTPGDRSGAPVIVFDDADVEAVVEGVKVAGYDNAGQDCTAACGVLAGARVHDVLVDEPDDAAGFKQSGVGKDMSIDAIEHYTELKHVMVNIQ